MYKVWRLNILDVVELLFLMEFSNFKRKTTKKLRNELKTENTRKREDEYEK
jgi:hypothetical protein